MARCRMVIFFFFFFKAEETRMMAARVGEEQEGRAITAQVGRLAR